MTLYGAPIADPLRPWETDIEPHTYGVDWYPDHTAYLIDGREVWREPARGQPAWWPYALAAALVAVLVVIGIRRYA